MTERRRFFPSRPVQTVPGRTVELAVQLRKLPEAVAAAPEPAFSYATWLLPDLIPNYQSLTQKSDGVWEDEYGSVFKGEPFEGYQDGGQPIAIVGDGFTCVDAVIDSHYSQGGYGRAIYGAIFGATAAVTWEFTWDNAWTGEFQDGMEGSEIDFDPSAPGIFVSLYGHRASAYGSTILLRTWPTDGGAGGQDTLTAIATIGGAEVARLTAVVLTREY